MLCDSLGSYLHCIDFQVKCRFLCFFAIWPVLLTRCCHATLFVEDPVRSQIYSFHTVLLPGPGPDRSSRTLPPPPSTAESMRASSPLLPVLKTLDSSRPRLLLPGKIPSMLPAYKKCFELLSYDILLAYIILLLFMQAKRVLQNRHMWNLLDSNS